MTSGACDGCGGPLEDDALRLDDMRVSAGPRGMQAQWSVVETRTPVWWLCRACQVSPDAKILMRMLADPRRLAIRPEAFRRCEIRCANPVRRRFLLLTRRHAVDVAHCPACYQKADVIPLEGVLVRRRTLGMWLMRLEPARPEPVPEPRRAPADVLTGPVVPAPQDEDDEQ